MHNLVNEKICSNGCMIENNNNILTHFEIEKDKKREK